MKSIRKKKIGYISKERASREQRELREAIYEIAEIIHMQMPLRHQDKWLAKMVERGLYHVEEEKYTDGRPTCCRNGCERCEQ
jgi:hypothetical protein